MALLDTIVVFALPTAVGTVGIFLGVALAVDEAIRFPEALLTAAVGALAWAAVSFYFSGLPLLGAVLALVVWISLIALRYPCGWPVASGIGFVAWLAASLLLFWLGTLRIVSFSAVGVPIF